MRKTPFEYARRDQWQHLLPVQLLLHGQEQHHEQSDRDRDRGRGRYREKISQTVKGKYYNDEYAVFEWLEATHT
jgi:hypothetical protein